MKNEAPVKKVSAAGKRKQAEWAEMLADVASGKIGNPDFAAYLIDCGHRDAREIEWKAAEKARIAAKKSAQAERKVAAKAERKARGEAECQICGRDILASSGVIAHHGYERPGDGWQTPSCAGARFPRYEDSRDRIPEVIEMVQQHIGYREQTLADFLSNPPATLPYKRFNGQVVEVPRPEGFKDGQFTLSHQDYANLFSARARNLRNDIQGSKDTVAFLQARFDKWPGAK